MYAVTKVQACVLSRLPEVDALARPLEKDCKKLLSELELLLPPNALTRLLKLLCREASAELVLLDVLSVELDEPDSVCIRLCRSLASWLGPPPPDGPPVALVAAVVEPVPESLLPVLLPDAAAWACRAAIRLCMNCWNAALTVDASELEELLEVELDVEPDAVADVLLEAESVPVVEEEPSSAPLDSRACMIADMSPPPGGGGGAPVAPAELVELVVLPAPVALVDAVE